MSYFFFFFGNFSVVVKHLSLFPFRYFSVPLFSFSFNFFCFLSDLVFLSLVTLFSSPFSLIIFLHEAIEHLISVWWQYLLSFLLESSILLLREFLILINKEKTNERMNQNSEGEQTKKNVKNLRTRRKKTKKPKEKRK